MAIALIIGLVLVALAVTTIIRGLSLPSTRSADVIDQIGAYGFGNLELDDGADEQGGLGQVATSLGDVISRGETNDDTLRGRLTAAGLYGLSPRTFVGYQALGAIAIGGIWILIWLLAGTNMVLFVIGLPISILFGWHVPSIWLSRRVESRATAIDKSLPELIDLLVVAVEAGMGFVAALRMTSQELEGPLAQELNLTLQEQTMGLSITEALQGMRRRVETPGIRSFVRGVAQGEALGVSIGQILRNLSAEMRKKRRAQAEERAQKAPVKMMFPLILLIFPAMFVVLLLPAIITISQTLGD